MGFLNFKQGGQFVQKPGKRIRGKLQKNQQPVFNMCMYTI